MLNSWLIVSIIALTITVAAEVGTVAIIIQLNRIAKGNDE